MTTQARVAKHTAGPWEVYEGHDGQFKDEPFILGPVRALRHKADSEMSFASTSRTQDDHATNQLG